MDKISTEHHVNITTLMQMLSELLAEHGDLDIVLSSDGEGNSYSPITQGYTVGWYVPDCTWSGEFHSDDEIEECTEEYDDEDKEHFREYGVRAMILWPVN